MDDAPRIITLKELNALTLVPEGASNRWRFWCPKYSCPLLNNLIVIGYGSYIPITSDIGSPTYAVSKHPVLNSVLSLIWRNSFTASQFLLVQNLHRKINNNPSTGTKLRSLSTSSTFSFTLVDLALTATREKLNNIKI